MSGIQNASVSRLKKTFDILSKKHQKVLEDMKTLCSPTSNFKFLREAVATGEPPLIPSLNTYLQDLTFIEDGNPDAIEKENVEYIYVSKRQMLFKTLESFKLFQTVPFNLKKVDIVLNFIMDMMVMNEKETYKESLLREPREEK
jgi:hypothetical protein